MKKRKHILLTISILAAIVAAVFIYIVIISVNNNNKTKGDEVPDLLSEDKILLKEDLPVDVSGLRIEEVCTIIATMIKNDAGYAATYMPVNIEYFTGTDSSFYEKVCKKKQFVDENSYDAMIYKHQSRQAAQMTEIVKTYKNGSEKRICIWDYMQNMWSDFIPDYEEISPEHRENIEFMCEIGALSLDRDAKINPAAIADEMFLTNLFERLMQPDALFPSCCFEIQGEEFVLGFSDPDSYISMAQVYSWLSDNAGIITNFASFDLNGTNLSLCFSTEKMGLLCWPLAFGEDALFGYDTAKYNKNMVKSILSFCLDFSYAITGSEEQNDELTRLINDSGKEDFEGAVLTISGRNNKTVEISVFQLDANGLRIQIKGG